jgi:hypothetical protein
MDDPVIEQIKNQVAEEFGVPLHFLQRFLELEEDRVHQTRRHGLLEDLRRLTAQTARIDRGTG